MADASDKARFYLERSVPELQELKRKKIFTKVLYSNLEFVDLWKLKRELRKRSLL